MQIIPINFQGPVPRLALNRADAAEALGCSKHTIWRLWATGKITKTSWGTYPVESLNALIKAEMQPATK